MFAFIAGLFGGAILLLIGGLCLVGALLKAVAVFFGFDTSEKKK